MSDQKIQLDPDLAEALLATPSAQAGLEGAEGETLGQTIKRLQKQLQEAVKAAASSLEENPLATIVARDQGNLEGIPDATIQISQDGTLWLSQGEVHVDTPNAFVTPPKAKKVRSKGSKKKSSKYQKKTPRKKELEKISEALGIQWPSGVSKMNFWAEICDYLEGKTGFDAAPAYPDGLDKIWEVIRSLEGESPPKQTPAPPPPKQTPAPPPKVELPPEDPYVLPKDPDPPSEEVEDLDLGDLINDSRSDVTFHEDGGEHLEVGDEYYEFHEQDPYEPPYLKTALSRPKPKPVSPEEAEGLLGDILRKAQEIDLEASVDRIISES